MPARHSPPSPGVEELPPDVTVRPATLDDAEEICGLMVAAGLAYTGEPDIDVDQVRGDLQGFQIDLALDSRLGYDATGRLVGYVQAYDEDADNGSLDLYLHPELTDPTYPLLGDWLTAFGLARLADLARQRSSRQVVVRAGAYQAEVRLVDVMRRAGFVRDRIYWKMQVELEPGAVIDVPVPAGITIERLDPDSDDDLRLALELRNETFAGHHASIQLSFEQFAERSRQAGGYDPGAWFVARFAGAPVGVLIGDDTQRQVNAGYVRALGVRESVRGHGVARALLLTAFAEYAANGRAAVSLGVDAENLSGATRLYESVGMRPVVVYDSMALTIAP